EATPADIVISEIGGTVGDIESLPFLEAIRQFRREAGQQNVLYLHVTLVPFIEAAGELKTKPTQHSVNELRRIGIHPDIVVTRSREELSSEIRDKIALFADVEPEAVVASPDVPDVYLVPSVLQREGLDRLVPGGFGARGWEGKILACRVARERGIPYLGLCLGMHVAVSEFSRHVLGLDGANSTEMDPETPYAVIDLLPEQKEVEDLGGTMRLGAQAVELAEGTRARETYEDAVVHERHRHRYEVNNHFRGRIVDAGLVVSGTYQEGRLVEVVELPDHPWF